MNTRLFVLITSAGLASSAGGAHASIAGTGSGLWLNSYLGATTYYQAGYTGSSAQLADVGAGTGWNGHETLKQGQISRYINGPGGLNAPVPPFAPGTPNFSAHQTSVEQVMVGRSLATDAPGSQNEKIRRGLAYGATLWSANIATAHLSGLGFDLTWQSATVPYREVLRPDASGKHADVVNSSWGYFADAGSTTGNRAFDGMIYAYNSAFVVAAGNFGPGSNTVAAPASSKNTIAVGALSGATGPNPFSTPASFSSSGPMDFALPTSPTAWTRIENARAPIDLAAPGVDVRMAWYRGASGENHDSVYYGSNTSMATNSYQLGSGTSFAAPLVAAGAALVVDAAHARNFTQGADGRVVRALLMNGADKTQGWTNNATLDAGVWTTTQGVDWVTGTGRMNLASTFRQQNLGTTDVPGLGGGAADAVGWDFGVTVADAPNDYVFAQQLRAGWTFTATLCWWADDRFDLDTLAESSAVWGAQDILTLSLFAGTPGSESLVAQSIGQYNLNQHLFLTVPADGSYFMRIAWAGQLYDFVNKPNAESYGLAWSVPAPGALTLVALAAAVSGCSRRRTLR